MVMISADEARYNYTKNLTDNTVSKTLEEINKEIIEASKNSTFVECVIEISPSVDKEEFAKEIEYVLGTQRYDYDTEINEDSVKFTIRW